MNFYKTIEANTDQMVSDISTLIKYKSIQGGGRGANALWKRDG